MRPNSSTIGEFVFGVLLCICGIQIFSNRIGWLNTIKILTIGIISNLALSFSFRAFEYSFEWILLADMLIRGLIGITIFKLTSYLTQKNDSEWNIKKEKLNLTIGIVVGTFPLFFRQIFF
jgi:hypothetical protein